MRRSVVRLFSLYNFFSVFLPGFVLLLGVAPVFPANFPIDTVATFVPLLALGFVAGQAVHSVAVHAEKTFGHDRHRTRFADELERRTNRVDEALVCEFRRCYDESHFELAPEFPEDSDEHEELTDSSAIYPLVQSHVHTEEVGRSRTFQAVYAFCRSLWFEAFFLMVFYWTFILIAAITGVEYQSLFLSTTTDLPETLLISTALCGLCLSVFKYAADQYREHFVQYLLADFVVLTRELSASE